MSGKTDKIKYCSLYSFVKKEMPRLYELLDDICAVGLFRSKYELTFLAPTDEMVSELEAKVNKGDSEEAFVLLQSLFIYGKHDKLDGELVSYNLKKIKSNLSDLKRHPKFQAWQSKDSAVVYQAVKFPEEGDATSRPKKEKKGSGEAPVRSAFTQKFFLDNKPSTIEVAHLVNSLLAEIESSNPEKYKEALDTVDPNLTLTWFFLVRPSAESSPFISDERFQEWSETCASGIKSAEHIKKVFDLDSEISRQKLKRISEVRQEVLKHVRLGDMQQAIIDAYESKDKLLQDELRFRYSEEDIHSADIVTLMVIDWSDPLSKALLFHPNTLEASAIMEVLKEFVTSNAFMYTIDTAILLERLKKNIVGAGNRKTVKVLAQKSMEYIRDMKGDDESHMRKLVSSMTKKQKDLLKKMLK